MLLYFYVLHKISKKLYGSPVNISCNKFILSIVQNMTCNKSENKLEHENSHNAKSVPIYSVWF